MRISLIVAFIMLAVSCFGEETIPPSNSNMWTYSTGLKIVSTKLIKGSDEKPSWKIERRGSNYIVKIYDYFYSEEKFEDPVLSLPREGMVTLAVSSKKQRFFKTKEEFPIQLIIEISGKRLQKGETVYFLNGDCGEVNGHQVIK
jgi:hypothetical protein